MNSLLENIQRLGLELPPPPEPGGTYVPWKLSGNLLFLAGVISRDSRGIITGRLGENLNIEQGYAAARCCALTQIACLREAIGDLDRVQEIFTLNGYVRCTPEFNDPPKVINGASDLLITLWGDSGRHVRAAIGVASLPGGAAVEIQMSVLLKS